ncbi:MAG: VOC family protein [Gammaproteobacteria bacterium]|nr:VOC family protein [Gammaproteobacteria bacterium]
MRILATLAAAPLMLLAMSAAFSAPVSDDERVGIDLRRTTLIVESIDNSLRFYRDALGMKVIYDNMIRTPRTAATDEEAELSRRLVFLRANDDYIGIVGLLEYTRPRRPVREPEPQPFSSGSMVLLFNTANVDDAYSAAIDVPGAESIQPPADVTYPSYDGGSAIQVRTSTLRDPDGFLVELNQLLSEIDNTGR